MPHSIRDIVTEVLSATDIVDVLGAHLELKPSGGSRYLALCPFHSEKTPSFSVSRERQAFYCFGCEKGGDAITFLREHEGLSFMEALQRLADKAGIRLPAISGHASGEDGLRTRLLELGTFAARFYSENLRNPLRGRAGREYLVSRGLDEKTVERFGLGYVSDEWNSLVVCARKSGFDDRLLETSGLVRKGDRGSLYDLFRNRLMFPIRDVASNVVAFGGRDLGDSPAKYINSPENPVYKKSRVLYGLGESRDAIRQSGRVVLVEGYFDFLRCVDAGIENVVATCGTALTSGQASLMRRYAREVLVVFDGDAAGIRAAMRSVGILTGAGLHVSAIVLPDGLDPDDFIREHGRPAFLELAERAKDFVTFYVEYSGDQTQTIEGRTQLARELFSVIRDIDDQFIRTEYLRDLARQLGLNEERCRGEFYKYLRDQAVRREPEQPRAERSVQIRDEDRQFVSVLLRDESLAARVKARLADVQLPEGPLKLVLTYLWSGNEDFYEIEDESARGLYASAANLDGIAGDKAERLVEKRISGLTREALRGEAARVQEEIAHAVRLKDDRKVAELLGRIRDIRKELERVGAA